ncbi:uncharacterized protein LOC111057150 isoform X2 [Nilaparvata lugens]|uniref:uncharacterized protein LOC111057150 isoform X2 n=1 Tax=Nilaparvata lugens TaxID=108931 RepID=UPI000B97D404|nr:uncharacterized protein LOC111057150 isoform X2 [Nilaparvata lugens]XP_039279472.1 uncharacterized protein LOC111057150 isoform X2 [Nilaparvata lugens]
MNSSNYSRRKLETVIEREMLSSSDSAAEASSSGRRGRSARPNPHHTQIHFFHKLYNDLPIVSTSFDLTSSIYKTVRGSNCISSRMLKTAERTADALKNSTNPIVNVFRGPLMTIDFLLCSTLDFVEDKVPAIKQTPTELYENTKWMVKYVCSGQCALDCVCRTCKHSFNTAYQLKNLVLCKPIEESKKVSEVPRQD